MKAELAAILEGYGLDAVVVAGMSSHNPSMNYFTGSNMFTKAYVVIPRGGEPILFYRTMERDTWASWISSSPTGPMTTKSTYRMSASESACSLSSPRILK